VLRALAIFDVTRVYGKPYLQDNGASWGAALSTQTLNPAAKVKRSTVAECYTFVENELKAERIKFSGIESFSTPRRVTAIIKDLAEKQDDLDKKSVGPSVEIAYKEGQLTKAGEGFVKSQGATTDDIKIIENEYLDHRFNCSHLANRVDGRHV